MPQFDNCSHCFMPLHGQTVCPCCGYSPANGKSYPDALPVFSILKNRYLLGRVLGQGGFGITYAALDLQTNQRRAIKEYMPTEYALRDAGRKTIHARPDAHSRRIFQHGKEKYIQEAETLQRLIRNPTVVDITDYFEENSTAYLVMEFLDGKNLQQLAASQGGTLEPDYARQIMAQIASTLMDVHAKGILHRDLSPENIISLKDGSIKLIDFGAARGFVMGENQGKSVLLKVGYAPPEQYSSTGNQGYWSDVYALCATFYKLISGKMVPDAMIRQRGLVVPTLLDMGCRVTAKTSYVIQKGLEIDIKNRYQNFKELLDDLDLQATVKEPPNTGIQGTGPRRPWPWGKGKEPREPATTVIPSFRISLRGRGGQGLLRTQGWSLIGRIQTADVPLLTNDSNISRNHCRVCYDAENSCFLVVDTSSNGTYRLQDRSRLPFNQVARVKPGETLYLATSDNLLTLELRS